ncbi:MAG: hypothetical protein MK089_12530, partial [Phycisphaerales bacterium]|nr:hypothetical protein [Phycisphaerales bacterium]
SWCDRRDMLQQIDELTRSIHVENGRMLREIIRRPDMTVQEVQELLPSPFEATLVERIMNDSRYEGYVQRQRAQIARRSEIDRRRIHDPQEASRISGLRSEAAEALAKFQPSTLGQAARLAGVTPADVTLLAVALHRSGAGKQSS